MVCNYQSVDTSIAAFIHLTRQQFGVYKFQRPFLEKFHFSGRKMQFQTRLKAKIEGKKI